jgi:hypothetical protein
LSNNIHDMLDVMVAQATLISMSTHPHAQIYQPAKTAMQSGKRGTHRWVLAFDKPAPSTPDALMGWNTQADTITQVRLTFPTAEEAVAYANAKRIPFTLLAPQSSAVPPKAYAENFSTAKRKAWDSHC